ncbi:MAG: hypothetical protein ABIX01_05715 [Chitinophagaceae bacterium]
MTSLHKFATLIQIVITNILDQQLQDYFSMLNESEKKSVLLLLKTFLSSRREVSGRISIDQYNIEIAEALAQESVGNYITQDEMERRAAKW